jgi:2-polyprenyl-3-methyl-5-hydroxy-6-metoxy-1,4-benzoquinol methylase
MMAIGKAPVKTWSTPVAVEASRLIPCALCGGGNFTPALGCAGFSYVRCKKCGLVQMNPQPDAAQVARRYSETHGAGYLAYELENEEGFLRLQLLALKSAGFEKLERKLFQQGEAPSALDIGCATGALLASLKQRGWRALGVEISPSADYARKKGLDITSLPLEENNFPAESFDVILASHLIEHLNDPASLAREACRLLKPCGSFFVTTPNIDSFQARLFKSNWRSAIFDHLYLFSKKTLRAVLLPAGFKIETLRTWGGLAAGAAPAGLKKIADRLVKLFGSGDVMIVRAGKYS